MLLDAVRGAMVPVIYPDRWTGPGAYKSDIYPSRWVAKSRNASQTAKRSANQPGVRSTQLPSFTAASHSTCLPLRPRSTNKRTADEIAGLNHSSKKRAKTNEPAQAATLKASQKNTTSLSQGIPAANYGPTRCQRGRGRPNVPRVFDHEQSCLMQEQIIQHETTEILAKIASKLRASNHALQIDRETLRQRWELDEHLQLEPVTERLSDLSLHFSRAEEAIDDALDVIEDILLQ